MPPTLMHDDLVAALRGEPGARYRVMQRRRMDPEAHIAACRELEDALNERWRRHWGESDDEREERIGDEVREWLALGQDELIPIAPKIPLVRVF